MDKADQAMAKLLSLPSYQEGQRETRVVKRLGLEVTLREMSYDEVERCIREREDRDLYYLLEGTVSPNFRDPAWYQDKMGQATPIEALKRLLRHGEVAALVRVLDRLNGYRVSAITTPEELEDVATAQALEDLEKNGQGA